ncbi:chitinase [Crepidotus variabilis]|uniref:Chitinase n=1 Tax=Crepidotus variabilis TaxID=179855 RepID=A0A9P6EE99_9AGAR|nr:chitinase [Crepidotus variabilis]
MAKLSRFLLPFVFLTTTTASLQSVASRATTDTTTVKAAWYTAWHTSFLPLDKVSWSKYTHLIYAFAVTTPDVTTLGLQDTDTKLLPQFVVAAKEHNVIPMLSVGGAGGSKYFSPLIKTSQNRTAFVKTLTDVVQKYNLSGLDIDWEFPGERGTNCIIFDANDTSNYLEFLRELRATPIGQNLVISAAVWHFPWTDSTGNPSKSVAPFADVLDFVEIMNYDVKSNPAIGASPSSPLDDSCAPQGAYNRSAKAAVKAWSNAGMPLNKLVLGVPSYGHSFTVPISASGTGPVTSTGLDQYPFYSIGTKARGDSWDTTPYTDDCGLPQGPDGIFQYRGLFEQGYLKDDGTPHDGVNYYFDECSQTPWLFNTSSRLLVTYDDPRSYDSKGGYIHSAGLRGFAMWEPAGDLNDVLLDSIIHATQYGGNGSTSDTSGGATSAASHNGYESSFDIKQQLQRKLLTTLCVVVCSLLWYVT